MGNHHIGYQDNNYKGFKPQDSAVPSTVPNKNQSQKEPLKCWECGDQHYFKDCSERKQKFNVHSIQDSNYSWGYGQEHTQNLHCTRKSASITPDFHG